MDVDGVSMTSGTDRQARRMPSRRDSKMAKRILSTKPKEVVSGAGRGKGAALNAKSDRALVREAGVRGIVLPWWTSYFVWWVITVVAAVLTAITVPYEIAFLVDPGLSPYDDPLAIVEYCLSALFLVDIVVNFNLAFYKEETLYYTRKEIALEYLKIMFWVDFIGVFPFDVVALAAAGDLDGEDQSLADYLSLLRLFRLIRLYRLEQLFRRLQFNHHLSLFWVTLLRNFSIVLLVAHVAACGLYFIARQGDFSETTWIGSDPAYFESLNGFERYVYVRRPHV